ncbi:restriction endonuclease subunit S [Listeria monocytogenes]|nr:restriction endonuclease subunit S [Listeria monocytogenes]EEP0531258.1 restriction endonuclease subunit S [Listeria monocytogenes]EHH6117177.1 restriction endonuclease subunit S [Listeria monocytogenes]HAA0621542.1 restriction endonuclease subunit S [Listeria monocytogenes]
MKKLEKSVPVIRFKGFSEAWEQRKVSDYAINTYGGGTPKTNVPEYWSGEIPWIQSSDLLISNLFNVIPKKYITELAVKSSATKFIPANSIAIVSRVGVGKLVFMPFEYTTSQDFLSLSNLQVDSNFGVYSIYMMLQKELKNIQGTSIKGITKTDLLEKNINKPSSREEQQKIGAFFKQLDNTITLHQRKLDALKLMKKGFLQQMFPKRGENIPKIRFDDFDDIWEQRILGEFLKESKIKGSNGSLAKKLTVKLWRKGVVPKEEIYTGSSATQYYIRKTGQFMYGKLDFLNQAFGIVPLELDGYESTLDSPAFDIEESINETFLLEYVSLVRFYKYQGNIANGSRRAKRIHTDTFFEMPIPLPNSNEQQKIGTFSQQIDDLIAFQQNKLEKLSSLKKSYLQNMFI